MNILIITPYIPFPLTEGGKISQFALIDYLRKVNNIFLVLTAYNEGDLENIKLLTGLWPDVMIYTIDLSISAPSVRSKAINFSKVTYVLGLLKNRGINLLKPSTRKSKDSNLQKIAVSEFEDPNIIQLTIPKPRIFLERLNEIFDSNVFDLVQVDHIPYIDIVHALPSNCKKVFIHHEIRFARLESYLRSNKIEAGIYERYILALVKREELSHLEKYDAIFTFSEDDKKRLTDFLGSKNVYTAPFPVLDTSFIDIHKDYFNIQKLVFIGGENHFPNKHAVDWFVENIGPLLFNKFQLKLHIIGAWSTETRDRYSTLNYIEFAGIIPDTIPYFKNSILLAPIWIGSGIRTKILYALAQGVPVVSTTLGCEGIPVTHKESIMIANSKNEFLTAIESLLSDKKEMMRIAMNAQTIIKKYYSQKTTTERRNRLYKEIIDSCNSSGF